ncbi:MAG TPA: hypothetical protein DEB31_06220 [Clostridiales bacterium]|nr:hypothetical protein [Clostridiales bacterium]
MDGDRSRENSIELEFDLSEEQMRRVISVDIRFYQRDVPEPTPSPTPTPSATAKPSAAPKTTQETPAGDVVFNGIFCSGSPPPGEGVLSVTSFDAAANGGGGYDVRVTIRNETDYLWETNIYALLYGYDAIDLTLAEGVWFEKGASQTFAFEVTPDMVANEDCRVSIEYTF